MPKIKQYDWDKLKPSSVDKTQHKGTKQFSTYEYKEPAKGSKNGAVKTTRLPKEDQRSTLTKTTTKRIINSRVITGASKL